MKLTIRGTQELNKLRMSMACMGSQDVRYYLNGVMFKFTEGSTDIRVVGTDGHRMAADIIHTSDDHPEDYSKPGWWNKSDAALGELIVGISKKDKIPKKVERVEISFIDRLSPGTMTCYSAANKVVKVISINVIDGRFPDWQRIIPKIGKSVTEVAFDVKYLHQMATAPVGLKFTQVKLEFSSPTDGAIKVFVSGYNGEDTEIVLMPCKL